MPHTPPASPRDAPALPAPAVPQVELSLEDRLTLIDAAMTVRLDEAAIAYEVNTAHLPTAPVDLADIVTGPVPAGPAPLPQPYPTPVAALLQRAHHRLATGGWCTGTLVDARGARCLRGAIAAEARGDQALETRGLEVLLQAIRRHHPQVETVASFNDSCTGPDAPLRMLQQAADLADARSL